MMNRKKERPENDSVFLSRIGFSAVSWRLFFESEVCFENGIVQLPIHRPFIDEEFKHEFLYVDGRRWIPVQTYFQFNQGFKSSNDVYIFQSVTDILAYIQLKSMLDSSAVFLALGKNPSENVLKYIKYNFLGARFLLGYPNNVLAKIAEIRIVGILAGEKLGLELKDGKFYCTYRKRMVSMDLVKVSLSEVCRLTGFRPKMRTLKPPKGYESYYELIRSHIALK